MAEIPSRLSPVQVLLIDDDEALGSLIAEFASFENYAVVAARTGEEGLRLATHEAFGLIILDVMLPGMNGFEVLERIRSVSDVPVLMLTTQETVPDRVRGLRLGADDYLPKPFEADELMARIASILRRIHPSTGRLSFISVDDVELDERSRQVVCAGLPVELTGTEFSLLQLLLSRAGTVLSRETLVPSVLGRRESAMERGIDSLVCNLRKKLGPLAGGGERIRSVRGVGYVYVMGAREKMT